MTRGLYALWARAWFVALYYTRRLHGPMAHRVVEPSGWAHRNLAVNASVLWTD